MVIYSLIFRINHNHGSPTTNLPLFSTQCICGRITLIPRPSPPFPSSFQQNPKLAIYLLFSLMRKRLIRVIIVILSVGVTVAVAEPNLFCLLVWLDRTRATMGLPSRQRVSQHDRGRSSRCTLSLVTTQTGHMFSHNAAAQRFRFASCQAPHVCHVTRGIITAITWKTT
jgi:hypothetical protein